jgi:MOSC domain-containing protein YiiM
MVGQVVQISTKAKKTGEVGLPKLPINEVQISFQGVGDDYNNFRQIRHKGSLDRAVLLMASEMIEQLNVEGWPIQSGDIGENITTKGIPYEEFKIGGQYRLGEVEIQITEMCNPCRNLHELPYVGEDRGSEFTATLKGRRGWYAKVLKEGVKVDDTIVKI